MLIDTRSIACRAQATRRQNPTAALLTRCVVGGGALGIGALLAADGHRIFPLRAGIRRPRDEEDL